MIWFAAAVMLLTSLPYVLGYAAQGESLRFTGFVFGVEDGNSYIAKMLSGVAGAWSFRTPYSTTPQGGAPLFLPYLLLGKLASSPGLHEQLVAIYHLFRILAGFLAILASYDFLALFVQEGRLRRLGVVLVSLGGGLGWLPSLLGSAEWLGSLPLDFLSPESFGFLALYALPHLALARALLLWGFVIYLRAAAGNGAKNIGKAGLQAGACWLVASLAQPLSGMIAVAACCAYLTALAAWLAWRNRREGQARWRGWRRRAYLAMWAGLLPATLAFANYLIARQDPFLQTWMVQNRVLSPHPLHYLLAYGLLLPFAISGCLRLLKREPWTGWFPAAWVLALPMLAYAPVNLQRRLVEGIWVAIVSLSLVSIDRRLAGAGWFEGPQKAVRWKFRLYLIAAVLALPSTGILLAGGFQTAGAPHEPAFRPSEEVAAFEYLGGNAAPEAAVLSAYETGNALPAWAPVRVVIGHGPESAGLESLSPRVEAFFTVKTPEDERLGLLRDTGVNYVFWGPAERDLGEWNPLTAAYLKEVYRQGDYSVFEVVE